MINDLRPPKQAYCTLEWMERERDTIFAGAWTFIGVTQDFDEAGDYRTVRAGLASLMVLKGKDGKLAAFHNVCRHRGAELLDDGSGKTGGSLVCPYHRWTYGLDGKLRGLPNRQECFRDLDRSAYGLKPASVGQFNDLVFVNPNPNADFDRWIKPLIGKGWPHDLYASDVKEAAPLIYDLKCDWKVFVENAIDGYHLSYLHENTLGGPLPNENLWERAGHHLIWYATQEGIRHRLPKKVRDDAGSAGVIESAQVPGYGGVYHLFPATIIVPTPYGLSVSSLHPTAPGRCRMNVRHWIGPWQSRDERKHIQGFDKNTGIISSKNWTKHPLESGDFQTEDIWICEKVQRGLESPGYEHGPLSKGAGAEDAIGWFHEVLMTSMRGSNG